MLYYLFQYLDKLDVPGAGMFQYVTFRASLAAIISLLFSVIVGARIIRALQKNQIGRRSATSIWRQYSKRGTPTMGGVIIIVSILVAILLMGKLENIYIIIMIISTRMVGCFRLRRRLYQGTQERERGVERKIGGGTGGTQTDCRPDHVYEPRYCFRENTEVRLIT